MKSTQTTSQRFGKFFKNIKQYQRIYRTYKIIHFDSIEKDFAFLKEATSRNVENFQTSLNLQQTYSASLCSHMNNIYNKLAELQRQIQHRDPHMNSGDTIQIEAPDFDPDIDDISTPTIDQVSNNLLTQGTASPTPKTTESEIEHTTPAPSNQHIASQETDWPDAILVEILSQIDQPNDQRIDIHWTRHNSEPVKIPQLEEISEEEQYPDLNSYLAHHNTFDASQRICCAQTWNLPNLKIGQAKLGTPSLGANLKIGQAKLGISHVAQS